MAQKWLGEGGEGGIGEGKSLGYSNIKWACMRERRKKRDKECMFLFLHVQLTHITTREQLIIAVNPFQRGSGQTRRCEPSHDSNSWCSVADLPSRKLNKSQTCSPHS